MVPGRSMLCSQLVGSQNQRSWFSYRLFLGSSRHWVSGPKLDAAIGASPLTLHAVFFLFVLRMPFLGLVPETSREKRKTTKVGMRQSAKAVCRPTWAASGQSGACSSWMLCWRSGMEPRRALAETWLTGLAKKTKTSGLPSLICPYTDEMHCDACLFRSTCYGRMLIVMKYQDSEVAVAQDHQKGLGREMCRGEPLGRRSLGLMIHRKS